MTVGELLALGEEKVVELAAEVDQYAAALTYKQALRTVNTPEFLDGSRVRGRANGCRNSAFADTRTCLLFSYFLVQSSSCRVWARRVRGP